MAPSRASVSGYMLVVLMAGAAYAGDRIIKIGNDPIPSRTGLQYANTTFLLKDVIFQGGVLFAYSAYFLSSNPVRFQIWRPMDLDANWFNLVWETRIISQEWDKRVDIYLAELPAAECVSVANGDRLGVVAEDAPSAVAYFFDDETPTSLTHPLGEHETYATVGQTVQFDALRFPYEYSVSAFIDTSITPGRNETTTDCPFVGHVFVDDYIQATDPPGTVMGPPGPPGPQGPPGPPGETILVEAVEPVYHSIWHGMETLEDWRVILLILAWLSILSLLNLCCLMALWRRTGKPSYKEIDDATLERAWKKVAAKGLKKNDKDADNVSIISPDTYMEYTPEDKA